LESAMLPARRQAFSRRLAELRAEHILTQAELGKRVGVSATCVWNWEQANTFPRPATLTRLAHVLGESVENLVGEDERPTEVATSARRPLSEAILHARQSIAAAAGVPIGSVRVVLDVGD
jgi:transcriptional regulator with XRE-family HTH domain